MKMKVSSSLVLASVVALSIGQASAVGVVRGEADLFTLQTHGLKPHLHTDPWLWKTMAITDVRNVRPGEIWDVISEIHPLYYEDRARLGISVRILLCPGRCVRDRGAPLGPDIKLVLPSRVIHLKKGARYQLLGRHTHWAVPDDVKGDYRLSMQVLLIPKEGVPAGGKVWFTPSGQFFSIIRDTGSTGSAQSGVSMVDGSPLPAGVASSIILGGSPPASVAGILD